MLAKNIGILVTRLPYKTVAHTTRTSQNVQTQTAANQHTVMAVYIVMTIVTTPVVEALGIPLL